MNSFTLSMTKMKVNVQAYVKVCVSGCLRVLEHNSPIGIIWRYRFVERLGLREMTA